MNGMDRSCNTPSVMFPGLGLEASGLIMRLLFAFAESDNLLNGSFIACFRASLLLASFAMSLIICFNSAVSLKLNGLVDRAGGV